MSFASLKKNRKKNSSAIKEALSKKGGGGSQRKDDERMWYPATDSAGNGYAVIRFMPPAEGNNLPWAKRYSHGFKENGQWFIDECPTTIEKDCPVCTANKELWQTEVPANRKIASNRKRKLSYYLNVYVVRDSENPENEGEIKIFRCGTKIFEMLQDAQNPAFEDEQPIDPFDFWEGADFKLKIRKVEGMTNYDKSEFDKPSEFLDADDEKLESIYKNLHDLTTFTAPEVFKDYDAIKTRFNRVIGAANVSNAPKASAEQMVDARSATADTIPAAKVEVDTTPDVDDDEDALAMFKRLAEES